MEDGQATAGLLFTPRGRDSSRPSHQEIQEKDPRTQHCVGVTGVVWFRTCTLEVLTS